MKSYRIILQALVILQLVSCNLVSNKVPTTTVEENISLQEFIWGKWYGEFPEEKEGRTVLVGYRLEFVEPNLLYFRRVSDTPSEGDSINFEFYFIDEERIEVRGRLIDEWDLAKNKNGNLSIHSLYGILPDGEYKRVQVRDSSPTMISVAMLALALLLSFLVYRKLSRR